MAFNNLTPSQLKNMLETGIVTLPLLGMDLNLSLQNKKLNFNLTKNPNLNNINSLFANTIINSLLQISRNTNTILNFFKFDILNNSVSFSLNAELIVKNNNRLSIKFLNNTQALSSLLNLILGTSNIGFDLVIKNGTIGIDIPNNNINNLLKIGNNRFNRGFVGLAPINTNINNYKISTKILTFNINSITYTPSIPICFKKGSKVFITNQGYKNIEDIKRGDFIKNNKILGIVSENYQGKIVKINKNAIGPNVPFIDTYVTPLHKLHYKKLTFLAKDIINNKTITEEDFNDNVYNVLLDKFIYDKMIVNNIECETLYPLNIKAIQYYKDYVRDEIKNNNGSVLKLYSIIRNIISH